jgi:ubiquinone/menaquinone biosynthesis C-methylase UbiE
VARLSGLFTRGQVFPHRLSFVIDNPIRRWLFPPERLVARLGLVADANVLELGPGSGYFSAALARSLPRGHLELFDVQQEMLDKACIKLEAAGLYNVGFTQGDAQVLPFPDGFFDAAVLVDVLGEIPDERACLKGLYGCVRRGGLLSVTEQLPDPDFHRFSTLRCLVEAEGFAFERRFGPPWSYTANFRRD